MSLQFVYESTPQYTDQARIDEIFANPGFGRFFADHMATAKWNVEQGWFDSKLETYQNIPLEPASSVFHYGQEIFEGLKAYRHADGSVWLFRPDANGRRFAQSAHRLALPELDVDDFLESIRALVALDERWVPGGHEQSLYIRPFMAADESFLGVRAARNVQYRVLTSPVGAYFSSGVKSVDIWVSPELGRVGAGGTGSAKCGGNYASSLLPQRLAEAEGCSQVLFLDASTKHWIEELGGMNFFIITKNGELVTPELNGNILPGVTRDSLLTIAPDLGLAPVERRIALDEVLDGISSGDVTEVFACGTAAVITPIGMLKHDGREYRTDPDRMEYTLKLRDHLLDIQYGRLDDTHGWMQRVTA